MSAYVVGLTGGVGSGKSAAAERFVEHGAVLVDTDAIARELTTADGAAMPALRAAFGSGICDPSGAMDREAMRRIVFADPEAKRSLESILHPMIRQLAAERCQAAASPYVILAVPLLVESGNYRERCRRIVVVDCPEALQLERVMRRNGLSEAEVRAIISAQASRQQRLAIADDVLANDSDLPNLYRQVDALHCKYLGLAAEILKASC